MRLNCNQTVSEGVSRDIMGIRVWESIYHAEPVLALERLKVVIPLLPAAPLTDSPTM
jgi:hypothetical protein